MSKIISRIETARSEIKYHSHEIERLNRFIAKRGISPVKEKAKAHHEKMLEYFKCDLLWRTQLAECFALLEENMQSTNRLWLDIVQGEAE